MAIFRSGSKSQPQPQYQYHSQHQEGKLDSSNMHDPILSAVNEAQPFEEANQGGINRRPSYLSQESGDLKDIFGQKITSVDVSNPTRNRNERPLDTIRGFEYAITGDPTYRDQLESSSLGWGLHEDFAYNNLVPQDRMAGFSRPVASFNGSSQAVYQAGNYSASSLQVENKKKKRGLFGKKK